MCYWKFGVCFEGKHALVTASFPNVCVFISCLILLLYFFAFEVIDIQSSSHAMMHEVPLLHLK